MADMKVSATWKKEERLGARFLVLDVELGFIPAFGSRLT
jgi:hypothetical protein